MRFDPAEVSYGELLEVFWRNVDPFDDGGQFCDRGSSYLSAIFVKDEAQRAAAEAPRARLASDPRAPGTLVTPIREAAPFYAAEDYHQDYFRRNPNQSYCTFVIRPKLEKLKSNKKNVKASSREED